MEWTDATAMAQAVWHREASPKELVQATIEEAEAKNPAINAIVSTQYEQALEEAEKRDFTDRPFAGVPIFLKDLGQEQEGFPSTSGSRLFRSYLARQTDNYVRRLEELGFIIMGRSNTPEFGFKNISDAQIHGPVNLPDDPSRNAGGSSGGAAALVSSGISSLAPASDGGGSIRIPASFNGLIGLKPTRGRIPVGPQGFRGWQGASSQFALTKTVRDTKRLLYHMQTCQMESPFVLPTFSYEALYEKKGRPLKIAVVTASPIHSPVSSDALAAVDRAVSYLKEAGHQIRELKQVPVDGIEAMRSYYLMNSVETANMFDSIQAFLGRALTKDDMELMTWAIYQAGQKVLAKDYSKVLNQWDYYSHQMAIFHQDYDLLLTPTVAQVAPKHGQFTLSSRLQDQLVHISNYTQVEQQDLIWQMFEESLAWTPFTQQANLTGQPAISLPVYRNTDGLSLGIQLTAAKGREDLLLQVAQDLEERSVFE